MADANPSANPSGPVSFTVRLVTPDRILVNAGADAVELPGRTGYLEALPGAAPLLTELGAGEVRIRGSKGGGGDAGDPGDQVYNVAWGFAEVLPDRVTILTESALKPEEIDQSAARKQLEEGQKLWNEAGEDAARYAYANEVIAEAESKLESAGSNA